MANDAGRQKKEANMRLMVKAIEEHGVVGEALKDVGISRRTFERWKKEELGYVDLVKGAETSYGESLVVISTNAVKEALINGSSKHDTLAMYLMNGFLPERFKPIAAVSDEAAKDMIEEMREIARENEKQLINNALPEQIEDTLTNILKDKQQ